MFIKTKQELYLKKKRTITISKTILKINNDNYITYDTILSIKVY